MSTVFSTFTGVAKEAEVALNQLEQEGRIHLQWVEMKAELELGHAEAKMAAMARLVAAGMTKTDAEKQARSDPEFADYCKRESRAAVEVTRGEVHLRHLHARAQLYTALVAQGYEVPS